MKFNQWMEQNFPEFDVEALSPEQKQRFTKMWEVDVGDDEDTELEAGGETEEEERTATAVRARRRPASRSTAGRNPKRRARASGGERRRRPLGDDGGSASGGLEAMRGERLRQDRIDRLCAGRATDEKIADIYSKAIAGEEGFEDPRDVELAVMRASRSNPSLATADDGSDSSEEANAIICALLMNTGRMTASRLKQLGFSEKAGNEATSKWQGASLRTVCDHLAAKVGCRVPAVQGIQAQLRAARQASEKLTAAGFSQLNLSYLLENVQGKVLLDAYAAVKTIWQAFCEPTSNPDFKVYSRYALDIQSVFKKVGTQGQLGELKMGDRKYDTQLETYGGRFGVDRKTWINDDLGAINDRIGQLGTLGAKTIDLVSNQTLLAGINNALLFHASNGNYLHNSANFKLSVEALKLAQTAFDNQVGPDNQPLGVELTSLMHGVPLDTVAGGIFTSQYLNQEISNAATVKGLPNKNQFYQKYAPVKNKFLSNTSIKDADGNALSYQDDDLWMLLGKSGNNAPLYIAFLNGQQSPTTLTEANTVNILGFELVVYLDFGIGYGDPRLALCAAPNKA